MLRSSSTLFVLRPNQIFSLLAPSNFLRRQKFRPVFHLSSIQRYRRPATATVDMAGTKRKATKDDASPQKKAKNGTSQYEDSSWEEELGIVDRRFYPPEMTNERCANYNSGDIERPIDLLRKVQKNTKAQRDSISVKDSVVHWFKGDLRVADNKALHLASEKAKSKGVPLLCIYIVSPQDFEAHITSPCRVDFILRSLAILQKDLEALDIPLYVETVAKRKQIPNHILELCDRWGAAHLYANIEYEVDELRREARITELGLEKGIALDAVADSCIVAPGELSSGSGNQYAVYSPWFRAWLTYLHTHPHHLKIFDSPSQNTTSVREQYKDLFGQPIPEAPENKMLNEEEKKRYSSLWPAGEHEAKERMEKFISSNIRKYQDTRNFPAENSTSIISVHLAAGTISGRMAVMMARDASSSKKLDGGDKGTAGWISEIAWRDFYKHVLAHWPYVW